jgi:hypothetical protein
LENKMTTIFQKVVGLLQDYKPVGKPPRGRPPKTIQDIDRTKVDEVIHDKKLDDGMRSQAGHGSAKRGQRTNWKD